MRSSPMRASGQRSITCSEITTTATSIASQDDRLMTGMGKKIHAPVISWRYAWSILQAQTKGEAQMIGLITASISGAIELYRPAKPATDQLKSRKPYYTISS